MNFDTKDRQRKRAGRRPDFRVEALEARALLAASSETFQLPPALDTLIVQARQGQDTSNAIIYRVLSSLESQLTSGPSADLAAGTVDGDGYVTELQSMYASYAQQLNAKLFVDFPNLDTLLLLQGQRMVADGSALNEQNAVGLLSDTDFATGAQNAINSLTGGPLLSLHTELTAYATATQSFESNLNNIAEGLNAAVPLAPADASTTMLAETVAYQADVHAALQVTQPKFSNTVDQAVASLISTGNAIASESSNSDAATLITSAINAFDAAILDTTGIFGPGGVIALSVATGNGSAPHLTDHRESSVVTGVSGTASVGGTATLTAIVTSASGESLANVPVSFTLDGAFAGVAETDSSGVATLSGVPTSDSPGTDTGGVVAFFAGNIRDKSSVGTGDLTVTEANTSLTSVDGTATFGGTATLTATLTSTVSGQPIANETVNFTLDGTSVGSATTSNSGIATLTGVTTKDSGGTHSGVVVASFAGDSTLGYSASTGTGDLVVSPADTTVTAVSGTAASGGTATLTATLTSSVTSAGVANETISFTLNGTSVGTATTNSSGVATLTGVANTEPAGTYPGAVVATFTADTDYNGSSGTGALTVAQGVATSVTAVSGTGASGGTATLTATLTSSATSAGIANEKVSFVLNGTSVGTATTNSSGVATLTGVANTEPAGTYPGAVVANFAGDTTYSASSGTGALTVVQGVATTVTAVSGTAASGGTATLTATLTSSATSTGIANETVSFTLNGTSVGTAITNSNGVATLTGVANTEPAGTYPSAVVATFAGDTTYSGSSGTGNLTVVQGTATTVSAVSGTAASGGTATLTATLTSSATSTGIANETISFMLNGTSVGTATTDSSGVATLTGAANTEPAGSYPGAVVANFAGDTTYSSSSGTGDLTVVQGTATTVSAVSGSASFGGTATLTATLANSATSAGIANETVSFTLSGTAVGTATTNSSGVATLTGVANTEPAGTYSNAVVATFAGDTTYSSSSGTGNLTVAQAATTVTAVSGAAASGGTATLTATLTSSVTGAGIANETVEFVLSGVSVGNSTTNSSGVATLTGVPNTEPVGTYPGAVVGTFAGDTNYESSTGTGNLTVVQGVATTVTAVSGSASFGGTATLTATLTSSSTSAGIANETVSFSLDGASVGTAMTNSSGVATLTGVPTSDPVGTDPNGVVANFAGDTTYSGSSGKGDLVVSPAATNVTAVSGTAASGGTATLIAILSSSVTGADLADEPVSFTLNGTSVGNATTDSSGVATLTGVPNTEPAGSYPGAVVANFAGNTNYTSSSGTGDLTVAQGVATTVTAVSGSASFGGTATLTATLSSSTGNAGLANETVSFMLDGASVGTAVTNSSGIATLTGVPTSDPVGTDPNGVVATFAGDTTYSGSSGTGDLVVSQAATNVTAVSGAAASGGTANLTATLTSNVTGVGIAGETVSFTLNGTAVGTATTNSNGVATLTGVANTEPAGTYPGAVVANFAGNTNYSASSGTGDLTVVQGIATTVTAVSGSASFGGTATLMATVTSSASSAGIANETVSFMLDGASVGTAITNSSGVATLTGVPTSDPVGTDPNGVVASFAGDTTFSGSSGTGDLVVSPADTTFMNVVGTGTVASGTATLTATLTSTVTGAALSGVTVSFTLGTTTAPATTDSNGMATVMGIAIPPADDSPGSYIGAVAVAFAGEFDYNPSNATGTLTVS